MEELECGLVLSSIGYRSLPLDPAVPFDTQHSMGALRWEALLNKGTNIRQLCSGAEDQLPVSDVKNCPSLSYH